MASKKSTQRAATKALRRIKMTMTAKLALFLVITAILAVSLLFTSQIEAFIRLNPHLVGIEVTPEQEVNKVTVTSDGKLVIHFLDVGQGDCTLIRFPDEKTMIVDGGEAKKDVAEKILDYIPKAFGSDFKAFDYCVLTHTDADHCGSLDDVLNVYPAYTVYRPNVISNKKDFVDPALGLGDTVDPNLKFWATDASGNEIFDYNTVKENIRSKDTTVYRNFVDAAYTPDTPLPNGDTPKVIVSDGRRNGRPSSKELVDIVVPHPTVAGAELYSVRFYAPLSPNYDDWNNSSNIMNISYNGRNVMLTGDAEKEAEAEFCEEYKNVVFDVDVFKLGHHGSRTSSSEALLRLVLRPDDATVAKELRTYARAYTIVSCGLDNKYGHPHSETMTRMTQLSIPTDHVLRTDVNGDIVMAIDGNGMNVGGQVTDLAVLPTQTASVQEVPVDWWHIVIGIEVVAFVVIFLVIKTKKQPKKKEK